MGDTKNNELDSYGVWVKHSSNNEETIDLTKELDDFDSFDTDLDLPDFPETDNFDDTDFSDMFKDDSVFSTDKDKTFDDDDTTLTNDELANITNGIQTEESQITETFDEVSIDDSLNDSLTIENFDTQEITSDISDDLSLDDFNFDAETTDIDISESSDLPTMDIDAFETEIETPVISEEKTEDSTDSFDISGDFEEEISLDDFMEEGFSDESVAAGNNGYEPGKEPTIQSSSDTEEVSLDDFMDFIEATPKETPAEEIIDEKPLEMDIKFDETADSLETEENFSIDSNYAMDDDFEEENNPTLEEELPDFSNFETPTTSVSMEDFGESEEIDLSDFGIDADAEETAVTQDVEASKAKQVVVDYDLSVGEEENLSSAPIINEIKSDKNTTSENDNQQTAVIPEGSAVVQTSLLEQIVADLSSLKNEINTLKKDLYDISAEKGTTSSIEVPTEDELEIPAKEISTGGFFDGDDTDETIALSGDELDNIMNNADFTEEIVPEPNFSTEGIVETSEAIEESEIPEDDEVSIVEEEEPTLEETFVSVDEAEENDTLDFMADSPSDESESTEIVMDETVEDNDSSIIEEEPETEATSNAIDSIEDFDNSFAQPDGIELSNDDATEIEVEETEEDNVAEVAEEINDTVITDETDDIFDFSEEIVEETTEENVSEVEPDDTIDFTSDDSFDIGFEEDDSVSEPVIDNIETEIEDDLPEEISIPTDTAEDSIFVDSSEENFIDSISEEDNIISFDKSETTENIEDTIIEDDDDSDIPTVSDIIENATSNRETIADDAISFDNIEPEDITEENVVEVEEPEVPEVIEDSVETAEVETNFEKTTENVAEPEKQFNSDLKSEIKSVLLYMDQLLENLPEDKLIEFAHSDEFETYKKLFSELGLS